MSLAQCIFLTTMNKNACVLSSFNCVHFVHLAHSRPRTHVNIVFCLLRRSFALSSYRMPVVSRSRNHFICSLAHTTFRSFFFFAFAFMVCVAAITPLCIHKTFYRPFGRERSMRLNCGSIASVEHCISKQTQATGLSFFRVIV